MTLRKIALSAVTIPIIAGFFACNSNTEYNYMTASSAAVKTFSLTADDSVLENLDSVYFSIDLVKGLIFNADSLPVGTDVTRLIPVIKTLETASLIELKVKRSNGTDTTYNYLTNSTDSIDFTNPVTLRVVSMDGLNEFNYTVNINVHKLISDSLTWSQENISRLPSQLSTVSAQRTALSNNTFYCLTAGDGQYSLATYTPSTVPSNGPLLELDNWSCKSISFPFIPQVESFSSNDDALFILDEEGYLYKSSDGASSWDSTSLKWHYIYGRYTDRLLGSVETPDGWKIQSYPSGDLYPLPEGMPVEGTSMPVEYSFSMSGRPQLVILGGRTASGALSAATWSYDGNSWVALSRRSLPVALENVAMTMYYSFKTSSSWNVSTYPTLMAFGGKDANGKLSDKVYVSADFGLNWNLAGTSTQLPDYIPAMYSSQVFVLDSYYSANVQPKIVKPVETWACPYIYMFGGYDSNNIFQNTLWRGVINRLSFRPIE